MGLIASEAPAYAIVNGYLLPLAVPLLLFAADMRQVMASTGRLFTAFCIGSGKCSCSPLSFFFFCGNVILLWCHVHKRCLERLLWSPASKIHVELSIVYCMKDLVMEVLHGFSLVLENTADLIISSGI